MGVRDETDDLRSGKRRVREEHDGRERGGRLRSAWADGGPVSVERGFRRLTVLVSVLTFCFVLTVFILPTPQENLRSVSFWAQAVGLGLVLGCVPWAVFYVARWIVNGFRRAPGSKG